MDVLSDEVKIRSGLSQGTQLAPLLFLLYINDIVQYSSNECEVFIYADDIAVITYSKILKKAEDKMNEAVKNVQTWAHDNQIVINEVKTKTMIITESGEPEINVKFHTHNCLHSKTLGCNCLNVIVQVNNYKYLGLIIDNNFKWHLHINHLTKTLRMISYNFNKLKYKTSKNNLKLIYSSLVESHLNYAIECWGDASEIHKTKLISIQNKIIDLLDPNKKDIEVKDKFKNLEILPINSLYKYRMIIKYYYNKKLLVPIANTRENRPKEFVQYQIPKFFNKYGERTVEAKVPLLFSKIPIKLQHLGKISKAKNTIKTYLLNSRN